MKTKRLLTLLTCFAFALAAHAQEVTSTLGAPSATTSLEGSQLPPPDPKFGGFITNEALQSKPWWAPRVVPPKGAPNVEMSLIFGPVWFG